MNEDLYAAHLLSDSSDANQISAACSLLFAKRHERLPSAEGSSPSLASFQPELDSLADLARQIQDLQLEASNKPLPTKDAKPDAPKHDSERSQQLASLHCQRARSIMDDDSLGNTGHDEPEENESNEHEIHEESDQGPVVNAVEKALEDALAAIALAPASAEGYFIAAQCARSLGGPSSASEHVSLALQTLITIISSSWLKKLEQMMHLNVHHQCATREEVRDLEKAFSNIATFLLQLLGNRFTTSALDMDHTNVQEMLAIAAASLPSLPTAARPAGGVRLLIESRSLRKWVGLTLAPAVRRFLSTLGRKLDLDSLLTQEGSTSNKQQVVAVTLLRDTLLVLTRVLLAMTSWRRCVSMPHVILYAELCFDLSKELGAGLDAPFSGLSRFEMFCSDAYARSLLVLTSEHSDALQLHQESLQVALATKDAEYEVRCHHHVGQAFMRMNELELAQSEFREMLQLSQTLGDSQMECLARYELGECCVQSGNLPQAQTHFKHAQTLCHQTAHAQNTWRQHSVQQAIAFYAAMKPARRGASSDAPKLRRPAIWIGPPKLSLELEHDGKRSLLKTLLGEQTEPNVDFQSTSGDDSNINQPLSNLVTVTAEVQTATAKLFAAPAVLRKKPETPKRTPKAWRDSVFAIPPSSLQSPVAATDPAAHGSSC